MAGSNCEGGEAVKRDLYYARLCALAYRTTDHAFVGAHEADEFRATLTPSAGGPIIAFRGSSEEREWIMDVLGLPLLAKGMAKLRHLSNSKFAPLGVVHTGFMIGAEALYPSIKLALDGGPAPVLVGHSLGGALACLVGAMLALDGRPPLEIVTFGAPRVGTTTYQAQFANLEVRQYRNGVDIVPMMPGSYQHAREPIPLLVPPHARDPLLNHRIDEYIRSLEGVAGAPVDGPVLAGENYSLNLAGVS